MRQIFMFHKETKGLVGEFNVPVMGWPIAAGCLGRGHGHGHGWQSLAMGLAMAVAVAEASL